MPFLIKVLAFFAHSWTNFNSNRYVVLNATIAMYKELQRTNYFFLSVCWWSDFLSQRGTAKLEVFFQRANYFRFLFQKFTIIIIYIQYLFYFVFLITGLIRVCLFRLWIVEVIAMTFRFLCFRIYYLYKKQAQMYLLKIFCVLLVRLDL